MPRLADLIEYLIGSHPHEVRIHEFDDRAKASVHRKPAAQANESTFADRRAKHAVRKSRSKPARGAIGATLEPVNILAEDDERRIGRKTPIEHIGNHIDEFAFLQRSGEAGFFFDTG